jgi:Cu(I)/Ag(I) efflux system membrane protein CusA/SilA
MMEVMKAVKTSNDVGGRKFEMSNMAYIVRGLRLKNIKDVEEIAIKKL